MDLVKLLDIFFGLAESITPEKMQESMGKLTDEIRVEVAEMCRDISNMESHYNSLIRENELFRTDIEVLQNTLKYEKEQRNKQTNYDNPALERASSEILRELVTGESIKPDHPVIKEATLYYYNNNQNNKIHTIKFLRSITGLGLKDSKDLVDFWIAKQ